MRETSCSPSQNKRMFAFHQIGRPTPQLNQTLPLTFIRIRIRKRRVQYTEETGTTSPAEPPSFFHQATQPGLTRARVRIGQFRVSKQREHPNSTCIQKWIGHSSHYGQLRLLLHFTPYTRPFLKPLGKEKNVRAVSKRDCRLFTLTPLPNPLNKKLLPLY